MSGEHPRTAVGAGATPSHHQARIAEQTRPLRAALTQTDHYTDLRGHQYPLAAMSAAEALLVLALLERHAETLHHSELSQPAESWDRTVIEARLEIASMTAAEWLRQTPLHHALTERASQ